MANSYIEYTANGSTTTFSIPFAYTNQSDVTVFVGGTSTSFTFASSSTISLSTAPSTGVIVRITRTTVITSRAVDFSNGAILTEADLDNSNIQVFQAAQEAIDTAEASISKAADGKFDAQSRVIKNVANPVNAQDAATKNWSETASTSQVNIATTKASEASASATASANSATAASSSASGSGNSATAAANSATASANSATASLASKNTSAAQAAISTTKAGQAASSTTAAANSASDSNTSAGQSATQATNSANSATASANSATSSGNSASTATTKANESSASAATATTKAELATTKSTAATNSATASANSATASGNSATASGNSATASGNSATASANSATAAASSASTATTKASEASTSASTANTKASEASTSASNAASSLASFTGQYVSSSGAPASPSTGDLWFDTSSSTMKVYNGSAFANAGSSVNGVENAVQHTATAGQTSFSATYDAGHLQVFLNGIRLDTADYTATNGNAVVLAIAAAVGDVVFIQGFGTFTLADHYTKTVADGRFKAISAASGGPSLGTNSVIRVNAKVIDENITFNNQNGSSVGPITVAANRVITIDSGSTWVII